MLKNLTLNKHTDDRLIWLEQAGIGYLEAKPDGVYDQEYFDRYRKYRGSQTERRLNSFRTELTLRHAENTDSLLDVGIGDGAYLEALKKAQPTWENIRGFDVNPAGVDWLKENDSWGDLYHRTWDVATFWDSLEHIRNPDKALARVKKTALISIPIFSGVKHVLASKHYRPDEHFWYFTRQGFARFIWREGFAIIEHSLGEQAAGREDVETFVIARRY